MIDNDEAAKIKVAPPPYEGDDSMMFAISESEVMVMLKTSSKGSRRTTSSRL